MPSILLRNIKSLLQIRSSSTTLLQGATMRELPSIENAFLLIENERIAAFGDMNDCPERADTIVDATGCLVFPSWCDSHTHLVYAGSREREFEDRINGLTYEQVAARGGGILNSVQRLRETPEAVLLESAFERLLEIQGQGTGAVEIKSGYGLTTESELKMLRVIRQLKGLTKMDIKATFLGAHAVPVEYKDNKKGYISLIINEMLPKIAEQGLADYCDIFCEENYFTPDDTLEIMEAGKRYGLTPKVHANQLHRSGGVQAGVKVGAISVDHLEFVGKQEINALKKGNTIATILPGAQFFLGLQHPPARLMIDAGLPVAVASDYNPGSSPSGNMNLMVSLCCILYKMTPQEALNAATLNGAAAMNLEATHGSITVGKYANLIVTKPVPSLAFLPYSFGSDLVGRVILKGLPLHKE